MIIINNVMLSYLFIVDANDALTTSFIFIGVTHLLLPLNDFVGESIRYTHTLSNNKSTLRFHAAAVQQQYSMGNKDSYSISTSGEN